MLHHQGRSRNGMAYGVDPTRREFYSLRQARYDALGEDIAALAREAAARGERLKLIDVGVDRGVTIRHLEAHPEHENVDYAVADLRIGDVFNLERATEIFVGDLMQGYPQIPSDAYDVVVCEQVLEHLTELETPIHTLERILKPGGTLFVGVPTFPHGVHKIREVGQPVWDRWFPPGKVRGHVQSFSLRKFRRLMRELTSLEFQEARGFRILSGGLLRPLEEKEWWWRLARSLGRAAPGLCVEIQAVYRKPPARR